MSRTSNTGAPAPHAYLEKRIDIDVAGKQLEVAQIAGQSENVATMVFLHEGLGSVSLWRDFPQRVAAATGCGALIYSRDGYGQSDVLANARTPGYMHHEAQVVLPALLKKMNVHKPILFGHSDGASIALIYAGFGHPVAGLILEAPHVFVEEISLRGIAAAAETFRHSDLPAKLGRHHRDAGKTFWAWHDIWTSTEFCDWNIESYLPAIGCPTLLIQGEQDDYGSIAQIEAITTALPKNTIAHVLPDCGHAPHREQSTQTLELVSSFAKALLKS
jgi:pimeloyl-ACP methyl ester carboxylesterase